VVLGGAVRPDGRITGADVRAWVELRLSGHGWVPLDQRVFTPARNKRPDPLRRELAPRTAPRVVPPPVNLVVPPSAEAGEDGGAAASLPLRRDGARWQLPGPVRAILRYFGIPMLLVATAMAAVIAAKAARRRRRRTTGPPARRVAGGWREVLDAARDLGVTIPARTTRREQATVLGGPATSTLADHADAVVFGPAEPTDADVAAFWRRVDRTITGMRGAAGRRRRLRARVSLASLRPGLELPRLTRRALAGAGR
jgi:hypothetical protein